MTRTLIIDDIPNNEFINILASENNPGFTPGGLYFGQSLIGDCVMVEAETQPALSETGRIFKNRDPDSFLVGVGIWVRASGNTPGKMSFETNEKRKATPTISIDANQVTNTTTLAVAASQGDTSITVDSPVGISDGDYLGLFSLTTNRFYTGFLTGAPSGAILSLDNPLDSDFAVGDTVGTGIINMAVDGSTTTQVFSLRGADPGIQAIADISRMMISCITETAINLTDFGDIAALVKGVLIRRADGTYQNLFNFKDNISMKKEMFDWDNLDDTNPGQGLHGFSGRLTFEKLGSVIRVGPDEDIEVLIQDDLTVDGTIQRFNIKFQGNIV